MVSRRTEFPRVSQRSRPLNLLTRRDPSLHTNMNRHAISTINKMDVLMPTLFIAHGGGPFPLMDEPRMSQGNLPAFLRSVSSKFLPAQPKAIVVISAHWEEDVPTVQANESPPLLFDYYGFPPETYEYTYPSPGDPQLADEVTQLLAGAGFAPRTNVQRGLDHGVFVPMMLMFPEHNIPCIQLSLMKSLDPKEHLRMGEALAPLRQKGVLLVGSGQSFHGNFGGGSETMRRSAEFDAWLQDTLTCHVGDEREQRLVQWASAPSARFSHPREEHLIPLMVVAGAASGSPAQIVQTGEVMGAITSSFMF